MFETTLLESAAGISSTFTSRHRIAAMLAGTTAFLAAWKTLPLVLFTLKTEGALAASLAVGGLGAVHVLMLCYVHVESRRLGLSRAGWIAAVFAGSALGFMTFLIRSARRTGDWRRAAMPLATTLEVAAVVGLILVPLIHTQALDLRKFRDNARYLPPPPRAVQIVSVQHERGGRSAPGRFTETRIIAPPTIPDHILTGDSAPKAVEFGPGLVTGVPPQGACPQCVIGGAPYDGAFLPPPPAQPPTKPKPSDRRSVISEVQAAKLIYGPKPEYPPMAKAMHIQGQVRLEAVIGADGRVQNLRVLHGHPFLVKASLDAVVQWRYQATLLNGEPVEVQTEIVVNYILSQ